MSAHTNAIEHLCHRIPRLCQWQKPDDWSCYYSEKTPTALFFKYNTQLGPPYQVLVDTNFINFSIKNKVRTL